MQLIERNKKLSIIAFLTVLAVALTIIVLYIYNIINWRNYPDFGFGFRTATGIEIVGTVTQNGISAGLQVGDRILRVNGKTFSNIQEFRSHMQRELNGQNTYLIERNNQLFTIVIENVPIGFKSSFSKSGFLCILGLCYVFVGVLVFFMKPHHRISWIFFLFTTTLGLYMTFLYKIGTMTPFGLETVHIFVYTFTPAVLIHLAFCFPEERVFVKKYPFFQVFPYLVSGFLFIRIRTLTPTITDAPRSWLIVAIAFMTTAILFFLGSCLQLRFTSFSEISKLRSRVILLGAAISASIPLIDLLSSTLFQYYILPNFNYYFPFFIIFPLAIGYSIVKHNLFDFDAIIKRTYGYVLTTGAIAWVYVVFVLVSEMAFERFEVTKSPLFSLVFIMGIVFLFNPVRNWIQKYVDRMFYRLEYEYQDTVHKISQTMRSLLKLDEILKSIMDTALDTMFIDAGCVMLLNRENQSYECCAVRGCRELRNEKSREKFIFSPEKKMNIHDLREKSKNTFQVAEKLTNNLTNSELLDIKLPAEEPFFQKMSERKKEATIYDIQEDPFFQNHRSSCMDVFDRLQATLIVPLIYENRLTGLISLGEKKSGKFYRREDINLLNTLANQGAVAIENARMMEEIIEKERMAEELSIARDLQTSMLPSECPTVEGFEITACSVFAREVGGDFFDFIEMGENQIGLVIGDVTGKSVSGALIMSASRSVFRMLSEEQISVGEIMMRANRRTKKDIKSGMFVALLFAVLNAKDKTVRLCSAGQTLPVYWSHENGIAGLVETVGDNFPLGILEDIDYQETLLQLAPGDKIVFYTDGIVEAMNDKKEIFGFDRLLKVIQEAGGMNADMLRKKILCEVNEFSQGVNQNDDLTIIVLNALF